MALQHILKNSSQSGKQPTASQLANGELALNYHADGPFLTCKDTTGVVRRIAGVWVNATAPGSPTPGELWLDISITPNQLKIYKDSTDSWVFAGNVSNASTAAVGVVELATDAETQAGSDSLRAVTPASLQSKISDSTVTVSATTIASSSAVKTTYDLANAALPKSGGTITGALEIGTTGSLSFEGATANDFETTLAVVDPTADRTIALPNVSGTVVTTGDSGTVTSTMLATDLALSGSPTAQTQAAGTSNTTLATTAFVMAAADAARQGLTVKQSCRVASTANISLSGTQTVDGVAVIAGDRVLVKNQTTATENGIYVCAASSWSRATDFDADADLLDGAFTFVEEGSSNADSGWVLTTNGPITVGTTALAFAQFSGAGQITAGSGLAKTANTLSVASAGITSDMIADGAIVDADINASAAIAGTKISPDFGSQTVQTTGIFSAAGGSQSAPSIAFTGDTNTGIYSPGADQVALSTGGTGRLFVDASGNVGINVASPSSFESGARNLVVGSGSGDNGLSIYSGTANQGIIYFADGTTTAEKYTGFIAYDHSANAMRLGTNDGNERLRITSDGKIGVGTTSPASTLHVNGTTSAYGNGAASLFWGNTSALGALTYSGTDAIIQVTSSSSGNLLFLQSTTERARIDSSGRLMVGTSTARAIEPFGNATAGTANQSFLGEQTHTDGKVGIACVSNSDTTADYGSYIYLARTRGSAVGSNTIVQSGDNLGTIGFAGADGTDIRTKAAAIYAQVDGTPGANDMPGRLVFSTTASGASSPTERMRINNAGELLVGYTSDNGAYLLQVNSQIFATSSTIATSDGRYKESIATLDNCVDLVKGLRPVSFHWKTQQDITSLDEDGNEVLVREGHNFPEGAQVGFIAQEVQEALADTPWLGSIIKENTRPAITDADGAELAPEEQFYGIAEGNLIAVLTSALQEAIARIETLEQQVATLLP